MTTGDLVHTYSSTVACAACGSGDMGEGTQYGCLIARVSFGTGIDRVTHKPEYKHTYSPDKPCPVCLSFGYACPNNGCDVNPNGPTPWCEVNQDGKSIDEIMGPLDAIRDLQSETVFLRAMEASNADKIKELEKRIEALEIKPSGYWNLVLGDNPEPNWYIKDEIFERHIGLGESHIRVRAREKLSRCLIETSDGEDSVGLYLVLAGLQELHKAIGEAIEFMRGNDAKGGS